MEVDDNAMADVVRVVCLGCSGFGYTLDTRFEWKMTNGLKYQVMERDGHSER